MDRPLRIAFVACNKNAARFREDPSFIYRCENMALGLQRLGHRVRLFHITQFPWRSSFDVVVFHRPRFNWRLRSLLWHLRRKGATLVADFDDLVIDESLVEFNPGVVNHQVKKRAVFRLYKAHRKALEHFNNISVSTEPLADEVRQRFPGSHVCVLTNAVHFKWLDFPLTEKITQEKIITYFPGTRSHNKDFTLVIKALERLLAEHPDVQLDITGPLSFSIDAREGQVKHRAKVPFAEFSGLFSNSWLNLAPLELTPFTRCKSALKVLEAGFWGVPTLCTPIPDTQRFINAGAISVEHTDEWYTKLVRMLDPDHYQRFVVDLRKKTLQRADIESVAQKFLQFVGQEVSC